MNEWSSIAGMYDKGYVIHATVSIRSNFVSNLLPISFIALDFN